MGLKEKFNEIDYVSDEHKKQLDQALRKFSDLGTIGIEPIHLELREDSMPVHDNSYPVSI